MKIAVPLFGDRVSPYFGASAEILLVETHGKKISHEARINMETPDPGEIIRWLASSRVEQLVCGGIQRVHKEWLTHNGIRVVDNQMGPAKVLVAEMIKSDSVHKL